MLTKIAAGDQCAFKIVYEKYYQLNNLIVKESGQTIHVLITDREANRFVAAYSGSGISVLAQWYGHIMNIGCGLAAYDEAEFDRWNLRENILSQPDPMLASHR